VTSRLAGIGNVKALIVLFAAAAVASLTGCVDSRGGPIPYDAGSFSPPDSTSIAPLEQDYKIAPLDVLSIKVFKMEDLSGEYDVDLTGHISLPLVGQVMAADVTSADLDRRLTEKLGERYLENPDVSVGIKKSTRRSVTVDGAVKQAGTFPIMGPMTLMQAVSLAGGTSEDANARRVAIFRQIEGQRQAAAFDLTAIRHGESPDPRVYPGDIVVIDGSAIKALQKQIMNTLPVFSVFRPF